MNLMFPDAVLPPESKPTGPTLVPFPGGNVQNLATGMRNVADLLEHGSDEAAAPFLNPTHALWVVLDDRGEICVGALGPNVDRFRLAGMFTAAAQQVLAREPRA